MSRTPEHDNEIADEFIDLEAAKLLHLKRGGGPKTDEGKARSSENSTKHGLCSNRLILPGEDPDEYQQIKEGWLSDYTPSIFSSHALVTNVATSHWLMLRSQRRCDEFELSLGEKSPLDWTDQDHRNLTNFMRYRTTAERTFNRNFATLEKHRSSRVREQHSEERLRLKREELVLKYELLALKRQATSVPPPTEPTEPKQTAKQAKQAEKAEKAEKAAQAAEAKSLKELLTIEWTKGRQWVEIQTDEETGEFTCEYFPTNEFIHDYFRHKEKPEMMYRYINFISGVPEEFAFTMPPDDQYKNIGGLVLNRMKWQTWLDQIVFEQEQCHGHPGPIQGRTYQRWSTWRDRQKDRLAAGLPIDNSRFEEQKI